MFSGNFIGIANPINLVKSLSNVEDESSKHEFGSKEITKISDKEDEKIEVSCNQVWSRGNYTNIGNEDFSIAHVRIVYKDYHLHELMLSLLYSSTNVFCYSIDSKASAVFKEQMQNLSTCFPNVYISPIQYNVDSSGHNMDRAFISCFSIIRNLSYWQYATVMQNYDLPVKTDKEMLRILKVLNGSNSIVLLPPIKSRVPKHKDWTFKALKLFRDTSKNDQRVLQISKGNIGSLLSRSFIEFLIDDLNPEIFLSRLDKIRYGNDEMLLPSLNSDDNINSPGGFTRHCLKTNKGYIARFVSWNYHGQPCKSNLHRHNICIYGYQDLPMFLRKLHFFANKLIPAYDYTAIACWAKYLAYRSTIDNHEESIDVEQYSMMPNVLFNKNRDFWRRNLDLFDCSTGKMVNSSSNSTLLQSSTSPTSQDSSRLSTATATTTFEVTSSTPTSTIKTVPTTSAVSTATPETTMLTPIRDSAVDDIWNGINIFEN
ncbi:unnamed protein product [Enterobius vermicularis]|uniref:Core-2/I-Branching enzyme n=1 Tax=Enterobius vermicularis TaxID=51028 RepID=A0A0N4VBG1_ENTVE|nr:unnamed protein product [Enterobius vermicularis]